MGSNFDRALAPIGNKAPLHSADRLLPLFFLVVALLAWPRATPAAPPPGSDPGVAVVAPTDSVHLPATLSGLRLALTGPKLPLASQPETAAFSPTERSLRSQPSDSWLGRDKAQHLAFSALWTLSTQYVLVNNADWSESDALPASTGSAAAVGVVKEFYDASRLTNHFCTRDLVANAVGIGLAVGIISL